MMKFEASQFAHYVCHGDTVEVDAGALVIRARIEYDPYCGPEDYDCYSDEEKQAWQDDQWWFAVMSVHAYLYLPDLGELELCGAYLGGIEVNCTFAFEREGESAATAQGEYLSEYANDLLGEVVDDALTRIEALQLNVLGYIAEARNALESASNDI